MKKLLQKTIIVAVICSLASCGGTDSGNPKEIKANMLGAVALGVSTSNKKQFGSLVKFDGSNNPGRVLSHNLEIHNVRVSDALVVISGAFGKVIDVNGDTSECSLIAFQIDANDDGVFCLASGVIGTYADDAASDSNSYYDSAGFNLYGDTVYFIEHGTNNNEGGYVASGTKSNLWRWTLGASSADKILELSGADGNQMHDVYLSSSGERLCVLAPALNSAPGKLLCTEASSSTPNWTQPVTGQNHNSATFFFNNQIINQSYTLDMSDFSQGAGVSALPISENELVVGSTHAAMIDFSADLKVLDSSLDATVNDSSVNWSKIVGAGDVAWVYGEGVLKKIDMTNGTLGETNYLDEVSIQEVTQMDLTTPTTMRIYGTVGGGLAQLLINLETGDVITEEIFSEKLKDVVVLN
jgi:hypothetical protein